MRLRTTLSPGGKTATGLVVPDEVDAEPVARALFDPRDGRGQR